MTCAAWTYKCHLALFRWTRGSGLYIWFGRMIRIQCVYNEYNGISNASRWHFWFSLSDLSMWLLGVSVYEKCMRGALHISVNIHTVHGCMDEWLSISCWIKTLERGNILPVYVFLFPWQQTYCCVNAWRKGLYLFVRRNKSTKWELLVIWSVSMCCWERWSAHKNIEDVHTNTKSKQTLVQVEMMNV